LHIRISEPEALPDLVAALAERVQYVVQQIGPDAVAVSVLGSFADGGEHELREFLAEWRSRRPDVDVELAPDDDRRVPSEPRDPGETLPPHR
jgi:hypothetical protein